jgi:hypothetical protein
VRSARRARRAATRSITNRDEKDYPEIVEDTGERFFVDTSSGYAPSLTPPTKPRTWRSPPPPRTRRSRRRRWAPRSRRPGRRACRARHARRARRA